MYLKVIANDQYECPSSDITFTELEYIHLYYGHGDYITVVELPITNPEFVMTTDGYICRANMVTLGKKYSLRDPTTFTELGIIHYPNWIIITALENKRQILLNLWKKSGLTSKYPEYTGIIDSCYGYNHERDHIYVLPWFNKVDITFPVPAEITEHASCHCHIDVLDWWHTQTKLTVKCHQYTIDTASLNQRIDVLQWWLKSNLELTYTVLSMDHAACKGYMGTLQWWLSSGLELKYSPNIIDKVARNEQVIVLQWWHKSGLSFVYSDDIIDTLSSYGCVASLQWWLDSGLPFYYTVKAINFASMYGHVNTLQWWLLSGLPLKYTALAINGSSSNGKIDVLNWWLLSGLPLKYTLRLFSSKSKYHNIVKRWLDDSGLKMD